MYTHVCASVIEGLPDPLGNVSKLLSQISVVHVPFVVYTIGVGSESLPNAGRLLPGLASLPQTSPILGGSSRWFIDIRSLY